MSQVPEIKPSRKPLVTSVSIEVPFHDVDVMNVVWHGHYVKYFEIARCALLRCFDYDYPQMKASGYAWPVVTCELKYVRPAVFGQLIRVQASLLEYENRLRIAYEIWDDARGQRLTRGSTTQVAVDAQTGELQLVSPPIVFEKLEQLWQQTSNAAP